MEQQKSKTISKQNQQRSSNKSLRSKTEVTEDVKKVLLGKIVQKTVEILKKPFAMQDKNTKKAKQLQDAAQQEAVNPAKNLKKTKTANKELAERPKLRARRKKETIAVDYPESSLVKLEKGKEEKTLAKDETHAANKPRKRRSPRRKRQVDDDQFQTDVHDEDVNERRKKTQTQITSEVNGFFYTNDKFVATFEDDDILKYLKDHYPLFMKDSLDLQTQKKQILDMLQNAKFMEEILSYYDMNVYEFFKFLFRLEPDIFKGSFLKRVQKALRYKKYAIKAKRCTFAERRRARLKQLKCGGAKLAKEQRKP